MASSSLDHEHSPGDTRRGSAAPAELLDAVAVPVVVVTRQREVVFANEALRRRFADASGDSGVRRVGDVLACRVAAHAPAGCGTARACASCSLKSLIHTADESAATVEERVLAVGGGSFAIEFTARALADDPDLVVCTLEDVSERADRAELERMFLHDVINTAGAAQSAADMLEASGQEELVALIQDASRQIVNALNQHRLVALAEEGSLETRPRWVDVLENVALPAVTQFSVEVIAERIGVAISSESEPTRVVTDPTLLRRVLDNLIRNACEASRAGDTVTVGVAPAAEGGVVITVHNVTTPPPHIADRMFSRAFSTKGRGRGYGTRSVLTITERYLLGSVATDFTNGTTVTITLPATIES